MMMRCQKLRAHYTSQQLKLFKQIKSQQPIAEEYPIKIKVQDQYLNGTANKTSPLHIAKFLSLKKQNFPLVACISTNPSDARLVDLWRPFEGDCELKFLNFDDPIGKSVFWHSSAHALGAVLHQEYGAHLIHGPAYERGFFYEFQQRSLDLVGGVSIEEMNIKMQKYLEENNQFDSIHVPMDLALEMFQGAPYKQDIIRKKNLSGYTIYKRLGNFIDLCKGPHLLSTSVIKELKITEHQQFMSKDGGSHQTERFYGLSFPSQTQREAYEKVQKEMAENDHRIIGKNQKLFAIHRLSPGSPIFLPHGTKIYHRLVELMQTEQRKRGYQEVITPNLYNQELWETSGHYDKYRENIYMLEEEEKEDSQSQRVGLKPMNCPGHCLLYSLSLHSYRDLPIRYSDFAVLHRNEVHGSLSGLTRVRRFVQDDAHIFCTNDQIQSEISGVLELVETIYKVLGFQYSISLSTRPELSLGNDKIWETAEQQLKNALEQRNLKYTIMEGHGAFYGPKIDFHLRDHLGRNHQCGTVQLDFNLPHKFDLKYRTTESNEESYGQPVMIHRAVLGSIERMIGILAEHTKGRWPFWLSPRQVLVVNVSQKSQEYAQSVYQKLFDANINVEMDTSNHTLNKKLKQGQDMHFNYILVVGEEETGKGTVDVRERGMGGKHSQLPLVDFIELAIQSKNPFLNLKIPSP